MYKQITLITLTISSWIFAQDNSFIIKVDQVIGENTEFWKAAGSDHLFYHSLKPAGQFLIKRMGEKGSHRYLRSHHTFNKDLKHGVIRGQNVYNEDQDGNPIYDFSNINKVFQSYIENGIKPIVEYDYLPELLINNVVESSSGNDEGMTIINTGPNDWDKWSDLMKAVTQNFIDQFGTEEVRSWFFEVWNEPDGWPNDQLDIFYKMYDIFVDAVKSVDSELRVGGPACYHEYFLKSFLNHVTNGINYVTGKKGTQIDFISYHIYGLSGKWLNKAPHIQPQVQRFTLSVLWLQRLLNLFPSLKGTAFHINEWGLSSNYFRTVKDYPDLIYRNSISSPLFLFKLVNSLYEIEDNYKFPTSLLLYWGFSWEADEDEFFVGKRELLTAGNVPKPIQTGFEMMALLKENRIKVVKAKKDSRFGLIATKSEKEIVLLTYNYEESESGKITGNDEIKIELNGLKKSTSYQIKTIILDKENNNTFQKWIEMGSPKNSKSINLSPIKKAGNLTYNKIINFKTDDEGKISFDLLLMKRSAKLMIIKMNQIP